MTSAVGIRDDIRYGYAVGRVRVLDGRVLTQTTFERLLDAPGLAEQRRVLADTYYGGYLEHAESAAQVERVLEASLADLYEDFLEHAGLPAAVVTYFRTPHDYANLRAVLKALAFGVAPGDLASGLGSIPLRDFGGEGEALPEPMRELLAAQEASEGALTPDRTEALVDRALFAALAAAARESKVRFLRDLTVLRIDCANVRLFLRARARNMRGAEVATRVIPGGTAALASLAPAVPRMSVTELAEAIVATRALGRVGIADLASAEEFDIAAEALVAERMMNARRAPGGPEPVLAYVLRREGEVALLRTILMGMLAGVDREEVRMRVRERVR